MTVRVSVEGKLRTVLPGCFLPLSLFLLTFLFPSLSLDYSFKVFFFPHSLSIARYVKFLSLSYCFSSSLSFFPLFIDFTSSLSLLITKRFPLFLIVFLLSSSHSLLLLSSSLFSLVDIRLFLPLSLGYSFFINLFLKYFFFSCLLLKTIYDRLEYRPPTLSLNNTPHFLKTFFFASSFRIFFRLFLFYLSSPTFPSLTTPTHSSNLTSSSDLLSFFIPPPANLISPLSHLSQRLPNLFQFGPTLSFSPSPLHYLTNLSMASPTLTRSLTYPPYLLFFSQAPPYNIRKRRKDGVGVKREMAGRERGR
ncbi:unnamed protein product [Acanthosepion pharaonis]|uniref:Uncharacterized protein n=1 Tax=Acanthosepion pharaonis TaxID=158019 RepID=A0A812BDQ9_ACAPH|nr:unnamed protein product [Sepia pharaonis]